MKQNSQIFIHMQTDNKHMCKKEKKMIQHIVENNKILLNDPVKKSFMHYAFFVEHGRAKNHEIVSRGANKMCNQYNTPTLHAEINAYNKMSNYYARKTLDLIIIKLNREGTLLASRPCYNCIKSLLYTGINIKHVYYSNNGSIEKENFNTMFESDKTTLSSGMKYKLKCKKK